MIKKKTTTSKLNTIRLKPKTPTNAIEFFGRLFPKKHEHAEIASKIFVLVKHNRLTRENVALLKSELGIKDHIYFYVLYKLKTLGILKKERGQKTIVSTDFLKHITRLADYYDSLISET